MTNIDYASPIPTPTSDILRAGSPPPTCNKSQKNPNIYICLQWFLTLWQISSPPVRDVYTLVVHCVGGVCMEPNNLLYYTSLHYTAKKNMFNFKLQK